LALVIANWTERTTKKGEKKGEKGPDWAETASFVHVCEKMDSKGKNKRGKKEKKKRPCDSQEALAPNLTSR